MNYVALTIGPIYKTLTLAKKTREIWGGSYFFSYFMKKIIEKLLKNGVKEDDFITPSVDESKLRLKKGVGLFADRLIFKTTQDKSRFKKIIDEVLQDISKDSKDKLDYEFLKNYLQINIVCLKESSIKNPIKDISPYLDTKELFFIAQKESSNKLLDFVKNRLNGSFLAKDAFENKNSFESLPEIALSEISDEIDLKSLLKDDELEIYEDKDIKEKIKDKPYLKYIAIVQADGDNFSKVIEKIGSDSKKLREFSKTLFDFCIKANDIVKSFGGRMIYAGGDDLLFFAPVANKKVIFNILDEIEQTLIDDLKNIGITDITLSFGVSITYYKYPLTEAIENAIDLLYRAKEEPKNQIAYKVIKHSGQVFEDVIDKNTKEVYDKFLEFIKFDESDSNFLHSIYTKIDHYRSVLEQILQKEDAKNRLKNFFDNNFNEQEHRQYIEFFDNLVDFMTLSKDINKIYATLRFKKFLLGDKK
jgi:CRISPR-associated protein Cmr2